MKIYRLLEPASLQIRHGSDETILVKYDSDQPADIARAERLRALKVLADQADADYMTPFINAYDSGDQKTW